MDRLFTLNNKASRRSLEKILITGYLQGSELKSNSTHEAFYMLPLTSSAIRERIIANGIWSIARLGKGEKNWSSSPLKGYTPIEPFALHIFFVGLIDLE